MAFPGSYVALGAVADGASPHRQVWMGPRMYSRMVGDVINIVGKIYLAGEVFPDK